MESRILVVDDEENIRNLLTDVLRDDGHQVETAANGQEALDLFQVKPFPLTLTDIFMEQMNGLELLDKIKVIDPEVLVIIMTSQATLETSLVAHRSGAYDYLLKPFENLDLISAVVNRALDKIRLTVENRRLIDRLQTDARELERLNKTLRNMAIEDGLTGLHNRRWFQEALDLEVIRCGRYERKFSLILIDIDHFKNYNDLNGHLAGDEILREVGRIFRDTIRRSTRAARFGGEEFVLLAPETDKKGAVQLAERLRKKVEEYPFPGQERQPSGRVTISLGVATFPEDGTTSTALLTHADKALYRAKSQGRNAVCI
jgi:diguanylate cyclase (GGDEF)-like protein